MTSLWPRIEPLLAKVQKPARYVGCEDGARVPDHAPDKVAWLLLYPDAYEIGLPNQGLQILYELLNERADAVAERSYAPWVDMEAEMRSRGLPLFSIETCRPAAAFDVLAFNLSAELVFTNVLNCVDLAGVPVRSSDRRPEDPVVMCGGHCTFNPEPLADYVDAFVIGDGEEVIAEITAVLGRWKAGPRADRESMLRELASVPGVYVPSMYEVTYDGPAITAVTPRYPDAYEIGLPNQGLQILYELLNERSDAVAERSYAPWVDMEAEMRARRLPLFSIETCRPAAAFDVLAFNLSAELVFTNVLNCVDLAGVPVRSSDRRPEDPVVMCGGHCTFNPEPLADYVDAFVIGDGEEVIADITAVLGRWKAGPRTDRESVLRELASIPGVYVPSMYEVTYDGPAITAVTPRYPDVPAVVEKRTIADLGAWPYPKTQLVPLTEVVHDRLNVEIFRGCTRGCRFCQAGMITRPVRERPAEQVRRMVGDGLRRTGYDEVTLTSLSSADYSGIDEVVGGIINDPMCTGSSAGPGNVSVSLPSLRVDAFTVGIATEIQKVRRTGLTFAPEGGTWRMRKVINKLIREEDLYGAVEAGFSQGWRRIKLYFLIGLPTESEADVLGIAELAANCAAIGRRYHRGATVTASVGGFVPKAQTPFQWARQDTVEELAAKVQLLRNALRKEKGVTLRWHDPKATLAEGLASRGDRRVGAVIEDVWRAGGTFQEWSEMFALDRWEEAMSRHGLEFDWYVHRMRPAGEVLPWAHISAGLHPDFLWQDWEDALAEAVVEDCRWTPCYDCGACTGFGIEHVVASALPPAGGSQGTGQDLADGGAVPVSLRARPVATGVGSRRSE